MEMRDRIIITALQHFMREGYEKTSLSNIAKELDITKPALYYHFKNKQEIFDIVLNHFLDSMSEMVEQGMSASPDFKTALMTMLSSLYLYESHYAELMNLNDENSIMVFYAFIFNSVKDNINFRNRMKNVYAKIMEAIESLLKKDQELGLVKKDLDAKVISFALTALVEGTFLLRSVDDSINLKEIGIKLFDNFWNMVKK